MAPEITDPRRLVAPRGDLPPLQLAERAAGISGSPIDSSTSLLERQERPVISFAMGSPAAEAIPTEAFATILGGFDAARTFDYGPTEGERLLRDSLLTFLGEQYGRAPDPAELLITAGGMQGLDLVCKLLVDPGDVVVVESPTYTNGIATITSYGGQVAEIPVDGEGLVTDAVRELVDRSGQPPRLIYAIPNFQNPSGTTMSLPRREQLVELAARWDAVILEDDPYRLLRFEGTALPSLQDLARDRARVIGVHTTSKWLAPGLRVGWLTADPALIERMVDAKQGVDTCTNVPMQRLVHEYLASGAATEHLERLRRIYRSRKDAMRTALERHFGELGSTWTDPDGGFFLWLTLPEGIDAELLFARALETGVAFIPGPAFSASGRFSNAARLCFASNDEERITEGVRLLRIAVDDLKEK